MMKSAQDSVRTYHAGSLYRPRGVIRPELFDWKIAVIESAVGAGHGRGVRDNRRDDLKPIDVVERAEAR
jgi:hypothetical protein